jgi:ABC-2 type transport system permease protein
VKWLLSRLRVLRAVALVTYKEWSAYRSHSMISIFVGPVYFLVQYFIWTAVYGSIGGSGGAATLRGLGLRQMIVYFGANALIGYLTMDFADWNLQMLVRTGKYLTFALRPLHHRFFALSQKIGHRFLGLVFEFVPCALIFAFVFRIPLVPPRPAWASLSIALSFLMTFYVNYAIGLSSFWFTKADGVRAVFLLLQSVFSGALVPLVFFPAFVQRILFFLPFQYTLYVPSMVCAGTYSLGGISMSIPGIVLIQGAAVIAAALLNEALYRASMRRFTGVGA